MALRTLPQGLGGARRSGRGRRPPTRTTPLTARAALLAAARGASPGRFDEHQAPAPLTTESILAATVRLARESAGRQPLAAVAEAVVEVFGRLMGADQATIGLVRDAQVETMAAMYPHRLPAGSRFPIGFGVAGWVAATRRSAEIADVREDRRYVPLPYPEVRSFLGLPLQIDDTVIGVISMAAWRPNAFAPGAASRLSPLAEHAALALRRAQADDETRAKMADLEEEADGLRAVELHELKSPLSTLMGFLEIVGDGHAGPLEARQQELLQTARTEAQRLRQSLERLVDAHAAVDQTAPRVASSPATLASEAMERVRGQAESRGVSVTLSAPQKSPSVMVDRAAIDRVLVNLLQNALRVAPLGSTIELTVEHGSGWACVAVDDAGPGVPDDQLEAIFGRYAQAAGRAGAGPGEVGLGLWVARSIVEKHGGVIWAENRPTGGARFCFGLPTRDN